MPVSLMVELHQTHRIFRLIGSMPTQIHDGIEHAVALIEDMTHLVTHFVGIAANPPETLLGEGIKPGKTETSRDQRAVRFLRAIRQSSRRSCCLQLPLASWSNSTR